MAETLKRPLRVFLCHASEDKPIVRELYRRLRSEDWMDPWLDEKNLLPGQDFHTKIEEAVESSDVVIICLSNNSVNKDGFVQRELRYAKEIALEKAEESIFLIPIRLEECVVPRGLRSLQWVNYFGEQKEKSYHDLLSSLRLRGQQILEKEKRAAEVSAEREHARVEPHERSVKENAKPKKREWTDHGKVMREVPGKGESKKVAEAGKGDGKINGQEKPVLDTPLETEPRKAESGIVEGGPHKRKLLLPGIIAVLIVGISLSLIFRNQLIDFWTGSLSFPSSTITPSEFISGATPATEEILPSQIAQNVITRENVTTIRTLYELDTEFDNWDIAFSPSGNEVAIGGTGSPDYKASLWDFREDETIDLPTGFYPIAFSQDGTHLAVARGSGNEDLIARIYTLADLSETLQLLGSQAAITQIKFFPDGERIAAGSLDHKVIVWDVQTGSLIKELAFEAQIHDFDIDPEGQYLAATGYLRDQKIYLLNTESWEPLNSFKGGDGTVMTVEFSPDGSLIAAGDGLNTDENNIYIWQTSDGALIHTLTGHTGDIYDLAFSPDGKLLVSASGDYLDQTLRFWDVATGELIHSISIPSVSAIAFDPNGYYIGVAKIYPNQGILLLGNP